jgi:hypothetical protein
MLCHCDLYSVKLGSYGVLFFIPFLGTRSQNCSRVASQKCLWVGSKFEMGWLSSLFRTAHHLCRPGSDAAAVGGPIVFRSRGGRRRAALRVGPEIIPGPLPRGQGRCPRRTLEGQQGELVRREVGLGPHNALVGQVLATLPLGAAPRLEAATHVGSRQERFRRAGGSIGGRGGGRGS